MSLSYWIWQSRYLCRVCSSRLTLTYRLPTLCRYTVATGSLAKIAFTIANSLRSVLFLLVLFCCGFSPYTVVRLSFARTVFAPSLSFRCHLSVWSALFARAHTSSGKLMQNHVHLMCKSQRGIELIKSQAVRWVASNCRPTEPAFRSRTCRIPEKIDFVTFDVSLHL